MGKQHHTKEKVEEDHLYSAMELEKYGFGLKLKISDFVSFLAWIGIMAGVLGILTSLELFILPSDPFVYHLWGRQPTFGSSSPDVLFYALRKRNVNKDFRGIQKILKIKCYILGTVEILFSIMGMVAAILMAIVTSGYQMPKEYSYINII